MDIQGNTLLITGGGSGIGRALAEAFHAAGNQVVISGRRRAALEETVRHHPGMAFEVLDVADPGDILAVSARIAERFPALNVLVNNAGIMQAEDWTAASPDLDTAESTIATNLLGPIRLTAALLPHLRRQPKATVVTVSSGLAFVPLTATPTYSATKAAIHSYSQSLRFQLRGTSVDVLELAPPAVATDLMPGHAENPRSMPLQAFTDEVMTLLANPPANGEICVEYVRQFREAEASGQYDKVFGMLNDAH